jgi:hypothetical protein
LFVFDLDTTDTRVERISNTLSKDYSPIATNSNTFYYLSDQRGIINLFKYDRSTKIYTQVTNFSTSIKDYDFSMSNNTFAMITNRRMRDEIYLMRDFNLNRQVFTPATRRKELQQARNIRERLKKEENKSMNIRDLINARLKEQQTDSVKKTTADTVVMAAPDSLKKIATDTSALKTDSLKTSVKADSVQKKPATVVNTDNYVFEDDVVKQPNPSESFLNRYVKQRDKSRVQGPFPYESHFNADNFVTSAVIDPLRGFGIALERQMNDMLENYRIVTGLMTSIDLRNGDFYAEAQYLPHFIDYSVRFDRKGIRWEPFTNSTTFKYSLNKFEVGASLPLNDRVRISAKPFGAFARSVSLGKVNSYPAIPPSEVPTNNYYMGFKSELVYDNSIVVGMNSIEGTRFKFTYAHWEGMNNRENSFSQVSADIRHYQKIYKEIVFAVRGFGGSFYGNSPKEYLLGGMDNWILNQTQYDGSTATGEDNPLGVDGENQDILFAEYATNLRGFDYASLFGNNVLLMNIELRIPLIRTFTNAPITSNFFRHLMLTGFYDIGSAWSGKQPFSGETSVSFDRYKSGPFQVDVKNYLNPWLYSYGIGMRSVLFGYYLKTDVAWPVKNYEVGNARWTVTLGFDF